MSSVSQTPNPESPAPGASFAPFYAAGAVLAPCLSVTTLFEPPDQAGVAAGFGTLWEMAASADGAPAVAGLLVLGVLVAVLAWSAARPPRAAGRPAVIAGLSALGLVMLVLRPGLSTPPPDLTEAGRMMGALCGALLLLAILHLLRVITRRGET